MTKTKTPVVKPHPDVPTYRVKQSRYEPLKGLNVLRLLISTPSISGKTVLISSILLDNARRVRDNLFILMPTCWSRARSLLFMHAHTHTNTHAHIHTYTHTYIHAYTNI